MSDLRIALRGLRRAPTFTATAVLTLGVGIGMAVAVLTVFDAVLLQPLPVRDQGDLVAPRAFDRSGVDVALWPEELEQLRHDSRALRDVAGVVHWAPSPHPFLDGDRTIVLDRSIVTGNFFELLGARPALGRLLRPDDDVAGAAPAIVLGYGAWQREFGGDSGIVGRALADPYTQLQYRIVGVAPPGLDYPTGAEFWIPLRPLGRALMDVVARLAPHIPAVAARSDFLSLVSRLDAQRPVPAHIAAAQIRPFGETVLGDVRPLLVGLAAAVALLLVIACVNVGNLLLVRATTRSREVAIRRALGAGSGDLVGRILAECALLALAGGALGVLIAGALLRLLIAVAPPDRPPPRPRHPPVAPPPRVGGEPLPAGGGAAPAPPPRPRRPRDTPAPPPAAPGAECLPRSDRPRGNDIIFGGGEPGRSIRGRWGRVLPRLRDSGATRAGLSGYR